MLTEVRHMQRISSISHQVLVAARMLGKLCTAKYNQAMDKVGTLVCSLTMLSTFAAPCQE